MSRLTVNENVKSIYQNLSLGVDNQGTDVIYVGASFLPLMRRPSHLTDGVTLMPTFATFVLPLYSKQFVAKL